MNSFEEMVARAEAKRDSDDREAYKRNAREHLADVRSMINDYLTNQSDLYIKAELLQEIGVIDGIVEKL